MKIQYVFHKTGLEKTDSPWNWSQIGIKLGTRHVIYQKLANFILKKMSMLTNSKVSLLTHECVFYRPEHIPVRITIYVPAYISI